MRTFIAWRLAEALSEPQKQPLERTKKNKTHFPTKPTKNASKALKTNAKSLL
jgi:hypothetical protein